MDTKELILKISKEEFINKGFEETSLRDIAKKCHITPTAIYRHFLNKNDIFNEIVKPFFSYFNEITEIIETNDYKFLDDNNPSNVWSFEQGGNFIFNLLFGEYIDLVKLLVKEKKEWFKNFIVDFEYNVTIKYIKEMKAHNFKINDFNHKSFKIILNSYFEAYINLLFDKINNLEEVCKDINNFYTIGFRDLLGF